jgi:hypothetical protein
MRFPLFFARYLVGLYVLVALFLLVVGLVDLFVGIVSGNYKTDKHALTIGRRFGTIAFWPFLLFSTKGRKLITSLWRNIL